MEKINDQQQIRLGKLKQLQKHNVAYLQSKFTHDDWNQIYNKYHNFESQELVESKVQASFAGRLIAQRGPFLVILSNGEQIQLYVDKSSNQSLQMQLFLQNLDLGDIVEAQGVLFKTKTGQLSLKVQEFVLLTKALKPLPDQYYGLNDAEEKYRKRYLDLLVNQKTRQTFIARSKIISQIRSFFDNQNYLEVDTPSLQAILGGASAKPFITHYNALHQDFYLRIATEIPLKKLLVGGIDRVYEIGKIFRNEGVDSTHNPEFTSIEFYQAYANLDIMMEQTENLFANLLAYLGLGTKITFGKHEIDFSQKFARLDMATAVSEAIGADVNQLNFVEIKKIADEKGIKSANFFNKGHIIAELFAHLIEPNLIQPTFVTGHPIEISPLAKKVSSESSYTQRAELFIAGKEFANMFSELNDPFDQLERFEAQIAEKNLGNDETSEVDHDFVEALTYGMPPAGGCGIGIDRLVMLLTNNESIREVILFPQLKNKK